MERIHTSIREDQREAIESISNKTGIPMAYIIRQGIDMYLEKHGEVVKKEDGE